MHARGKSGLTFRLLQYILWCRMGIYRRFTNPASAALVFFILFLASVQSSIPHQSGKSHRDYLERWQFIRIFKHYFKIVTTNIQWYFTSCLFQERSSFTMFLSRASVSSCVRMAHSSLPVLELLVRTLSTFLLTNEGMPNIYCISNVLPGQKNIQSQWELCIEDFLDKVVLNRLTSCGTTFYAHHTRFLSPRGKIDLAFHIHRYNRTL